MESNPSFNGDGTRLLSLWTMARTEGYQQVSRKSVAYTEIKQLLITAIQSEATQICRGPEAEHLSQFFHCHDKQCCKRPHPPRYATRDASFDVLLAVHLISVLSLPVHRTAIYRVWRYQMLYNTILTSWWWAHSARNMYRHIINLL